MTEPAAAGWDWFAGPLPTGPLPTGLPPDEDPAPAFARCFAGRDGARVLAHLRRLTLERALGAEAPAEALRHLEGQRVLMLTILALIARGRGPAFPPASPSP